MLHYKDCRENVEVGQHFDLSSVLVLRKRKQYFLEVEGLGRIVHSQWTQLSLYLPHFGLRMDTKLHYTLVLFGNTRQWPGAETQYFSIK